jgi:PEP-CTERM motif
MTGSARVRPAKWALHSRIFQTVLIVILIGMALLSPTKGNAASGITYQFDNEFSSGTPPAGPAPWITATIQTVTPGTVQFTIANNGLLSSEFVSGFYLNLNTNFNPLNLSISYISSAGSFLIPSVASGTIELGTDSFKADGDGKYDLLFDFSTVSGSTFGAGESITYQISGISGLVADDFVYLSAPNGGHGPFYAAAHVQGIGPTGGLSGWVEPSLGAQPFLVPEPSSSVLVALGLGFLGFVRRLKIGKSNG